MRQRAFAMLACGAVPLALASLARPVRLVTRGGSTRDWKRYAMRTTVLDATTGEDLSSRIPWTYAHDLMWKELVRIDAFVKPIRTNAFGEIKTEPMLLRVVERRFEP